jgi:hypothetical protein
MLGIVGVPISVIGVVGIFIVGVVMIIWITVPVITKIITSGITVQ